MSVKSKSCESKAIDRPFDKATWARAKKIAGEYKVILEREDDVWYGHGLELPTAFGDGPNVEEAVQETLDAMTGVVAHMLEEGLEPPAPSREGNRSVQINIRVTPEEKVALESKSRSRGFRGLSDFIRASVLVEK